jgi:hypothetical protein
MQTSIEWLFKKLFDEPKDKFNWFALFNKAKEMHKQEIIDAVNEGIKEGYRDYIDTEWGRQNDYNPEQYYQETFKKD